MLYLAFGILIGYILYRGYKNTKSVTINHMKIGKSSSTTSQPTLNILQISDMHLENISISAEQLYEELKGKPIDLIALTGDFLDRKRTIPKLVPYLKVFQQLQPVYGTYAVYGNHDYVLREANFNQLDDLLKKYGVLTMRNEHTTINVNGKRVNIIGIDDSSTGRSNLNASYEKMENGYRLILTHDPNIVLQMKDYEFDYLLSGHFHGGQIHWPKPYHLVKMGKLPLMNMVKGLHHYDGKPFYISEGLGQTGINVRFGSRPEITFHHIELLAEKRSHEESIAG